MYRHYIPLVFLFLIGACSGPRQGSTSEPPADANASHSWVVPPIGSVVAADSMEFGEDNLNHFYFSVAVRVSEDNGKPGVYGTAYDIVTGYGPNKALGHMTMPRGGNNLKPIIHKDNSEDYSFIIGFIPGAEYGGADSFQPYYKVSAKNGEIAIKQLHGYSFD